MKKLLIVLMLLTGCKQSTDGGEAGNQVGGPGQQASSGGRAGGGGRLTELVGLYESGRGQQKNQMCIVEGSEGEARFGLVVWGGAMHSCSGSGTADKNGDRLVLKMAGDEACTVEATITGKTVTLPQAVPSGCSYYCGARARLGGASFTQSGTTEQAAGQAKDLVGDPLCQKS